MKIKEYDQWLLWQMPNGRKIPVNKWGDVSGSTHVDDYISWAEANEIDVTRKIVCMGLAFCFTKDDPFVGIDLDDCMADPYTPKEWVMPILEKFAGTYYELSPSLTGIKIYCQGKLPEQMKHSAQVEDGGVEAYEHGRFFTFTEMKRSTAEEVTEQQEAIDWLVERHLKIEVLEAIEVLEVPSKVPSVRMGIPVNDLDQRAADYVANCERPMTGGRNRAAFSIAGHLLAMGLSLSSAEQHVQQWNASLPEPMSMEEVSQTCANAEKNGTPRDPKPDQMLHLPGQVSYPGVDLSMVLANLEKPEAVSASVPASIVLNPPAKPKPRGVLNPLAQVSPLTAPDFANVPGFLGTYTRHVMETSRYPSAALAFSGALAALSVLTCRKVTDDSIYSTRSNIYVLVSAPTGAGKEHPRKKNKELFRAISAIDLVGPEKIGSTAGVVSWLTEHNPLLMQLDEVGYLFASTNNQRAIHLTGLPAELMSLYSSAGSHWIGAAYADTEKTRQICDPNLVLLGSSTPDKLWNGLTPENVSNGLLGRCMLFDVPESPELDRSSEASPIPAEVVGFATAWFESNPGGGNLGPEPCVARYTPEARKRFDEHEDAIHDRSKSDGDRDRDIWKRAPERTAKLALLMACSRQVPEEIEITLDDVQNAIQLSNWMTRVLCYRAINNMAENETERKSLRILDKIKREPGVSKTEITKATQGINRRDRDDIIKSLLEAEEITSIVVQTGGRPKIAYYPADWFREDPC